MPITTSTEPTTGARVHEVAGELTLEELSGALKAVYEAPDFDPDRDVLWDLRGATVTSFSSDDIRSVTELVRKHWGTSEKSRGALVVSSDVGFGLARMYQQLLDNGSSGEVRVFRDYDEAVSWLSGQAPHP